MLVDPDGRRIEGLRRSDARKFCADIYRVLSGDKFSNIRNLIKVEGKVFNSIDMSALNSAINDIAITKDESTFINMVANTINSTDVHTIEYLTWDFVSSVDPKCMKII